eukprot:1795751-Pyramimonas_sp.AAC.1
MFYRSRPTCCGRWRRWARSQARPLCDASWSTPAPTWRTTTRRSSPTPSGKDPTRRSSPTPSGKDPTRRSAPTNQQAATPSGVA